MLILLQDHAEQKVIPLSELRKSRHIPMSRRGNRIALSTIHRWATRGVNGVQLPVIKIGSVYCSSEKALVRFFEEITTAGHADIGDDRAPLPKSCGPGTLLRRSSGNSSSASAELDAVGI